MRKVVLLIALFIPLIAKGSVFCIPGFLVCYKDMDPIARALQKEGMQVCIWNYSSREKTIWGHAHDLCNKLQFLACQNPGEPIDIVAHSIGALIFKAALNLPECPFEAKIGRAVLIAPVDHGSSLARKFRKVLLIRWIMGSKTGKELMRYQADDFKQFGEYPQSMQLMVLAGIDGSSLFIKEPNDGYLTLEETYVDAIHTRYILEMNHGEMLSERYAIQLVKDFILYGPPDCR